jgi:aerobic-type carbon monoxide dehydrogenase small subunit (CoxS/CutS family)
MSTTKTATETIELSVTVNGDEYEREIPSRMLLVHFLREELGLTGSRIGCETSSCGACTTLLDGKRVKSCTLLAAQANDREVTTIEGLADDDELNSIQQLFSEKHALQCGYCTAGMVMSAHGLLSEDKELTRDEIKHGMAGNLCRCTGYNFIVDAIEDAATSDDLPDEVL